MTHSPSTPANPAQVTDAQIEHMVQRFLGWRLPESFGPDAGIHFERVSNAGTPYEYKHEPVGTNLFDYTEAKVMVQHMLEGLPAIGAGGHAVAWTVYDWEYQDPKTGDWNYARTPERAERLAAEGVKLTPVYVPSSALSQPHPADERVVEAQPRLIEIDLTKCDKRGKNTHGGNSIEPGVLYLAQYAGHLHTVVFNEVWFGLSSPSMGFHAQYDPPGENCSRWERLWKIELPAALAQEGRKDG